MIADCPRQTQKHTSPLCCRLPLQARQAPAPNADARRQGVSWRQGRARSAVGWTRSGESVDGGGCGRESEFVSAQRPTNAAATGPGHGPGQHDGRAGRWRWAAARRILSSGAWRGERAGRAVLLRRPRWIEAGIRWRAASGSGGEGRG